MTIQDLIDRLKGQAAKCPDGLNSQVLIWDSGIYEVSEVFQEMEEEEAVIIYKSRELK